MKKFLINTLRFEAKFRNYILVLLVILLYTQLFTPLIETLLINKIAPYLNIRHSLWGDVVFGALFLTALLALLIKIKVSFWKKKPKIQDTVWPFFIISLYTLHRFNILDTASWHFQSFDSLSPLKYSDGLIILSLVFMYNPKLHLRKIKKIEGVPELYEDNFIRTNGGLDIFKRTEYAKYVAKLVLNQKSKTSFAIGIRGSWGSGKSV